MKAILALFLTYLSSLAFGWIDVGHMIVVAIAEPEITAKARKEIDRLLPIGSLDKSRTFWTAACWADDTKNQANGPWHYINYHFREDGKRVDNLPLAENVEWAIEKQSAILRDPKQSDLDRANALRFLLHFVGDIHQPMHSIARDTDEFPRGDRGGNDFKLLPPAGVKLEPKNLHFLWDLACGLYGDVVRPLDKADTKMIGDLGKAIRAEYPRSSFKEVSETSPKVWALESFDLARKLAYNMTEKTEPSADYLRKGQIVCKKRLALAGYRLADLLNRLLS